MSSSFYLRGNNNGADEDGKSYTTYNKLYNKSLLIGSLFVIAISRSSITNQQNHVPEPFQSLPTIYYGSQVLLALSFFISFIGLVTSDSDTQEKFSRFCSLYSIFCFAVIILVCSPVFMFPELNMPLWFETQVYNGVALITQPFPLFLGLLSAIPVLHYLTPEPVGW